MSGVLWTNKGCLPISWQDATEKGWVANAIYYYKGSDWGNTYSFETTDNNVLLVPWIGYWVRFEKDDDSYSLVIPKP